MTANKCTACIKESINVRTEVLLPTEDDRLKNKITKAIIYRCEDHINFNAEEMMSFTQMKKSN